MEITRLGEIRGLSTPRRTSIGLIFGGALQIASARVGLRDRGVMGVGGIGAEPRICAARLERWDLQLG